MEREPKKATSTPRAGAAAPAPVRRKPSAPELRALTNPTTRPATAPTFDELLEVTLPVGAPPTTLAEQRAWAEIRKLQLETERTVLELASLRRRERDLVADASEAHVYTFYSSVEAETVQQCMAELGQWSRRDPGSPITVIFN